MAYTNLRVDNFTLSDNLVFTSNNSPSQQIDYAFCRVKCNIDLATVKSEAPIDFEVKQILYRVDIALYVHPKRCTVKFKSNNGS